MRFFAVLGFLFVSLVSISAAHAGFDRWSSDVEDDPFSKGISVMVSNFSSVRSGAVVLCDTASRKLTVRNIPGFAYDSVLDGVQPEFSVAIDGEIILTQSGTTGSVGDHLAISEIELEGELADNFIKSFMAAKRQVAFKDGISQKPAIFSAKGSTASGKDLARCLSK